jgi:predicted Fe-Mo cluster-binding NifX family protein
MKIAVSSTGKDLSSDIDPRFGRAAYFLVVDPDTLDFDVVENNQNLNLPQGAGIQAATAIGNQKVGVLLTGNCGPKAFKVLEVSNIQVFIGMKGRVIDAVQSFKDGGLTPCDSANVEGHWV